MVGAILAWLVVGAVPVPEVVGLPVEIRWSAPDSCPSQGELEADIALLAGAAPVGGQGAERVDAQISPVDAGYALKLRRSAADGTVIEQREIVGSDCKLLGRAAALIVAVGVDPLRTAARIGAPERAAVAEPIVAPHGAREPDVSAVRLADPVAAPALEPAAPSNPRPVAQRRRWRHRFVAGALGGLAVGVVPGPTGAVGGWIGYQYGPLRIELAGDHAFARTRRLDDGVSIAASSSGGAVYVLFTPEIGPVIGIVGLGVQLGALRGAGVGSRVRELDAIDWWAAAPVIAGLEWPPRSRIALRVEVELAVALRRPGLALRHDGEPAGGFRRPEAAARVLVGPTLRLP